MNLSFNHIGNLGHLGNQMFQYAALIGLAKKHNRSIIIPPKDIFGKHYYTKLRSSIYDAFDINEAVGITDYPTLQEGHFHFNAELYKSLPESDLNLYGFFQTEKYFAEAREEILKAFTFKSEHMELAKFMRDQLSGPVIAIHVRRTDYVSNPNHDAVGLDYYEKALELVPNNIPVIIFTDDPEWAKIQPLFPDDRFLVSETDSAYVDMALMSLCDYHIIANSTFSWWGSWLSDSKKVIAPSKWFGPNLNHNTKDIYCDWWTVVKL